MPNIAPTWSLENWQLKNGEEDWFMMEEHQAFAPNFIPKSDTTIGPYKLFFKSIAKNNVAQTLITIRAELYSNNKSKKEIEETLHFDANIGHEVSALISLAIGVKIRYGGITRRISHPSITLSDPFGEPLLPESEWRPPLEVADLFPILPSTSGTKFADDLTVLNNLINAKPAQYKAFINSARIYQDSLELADRDPNLSWILMVSALETAANIENLLLTEPITLFECAHPNLHEFLSEHKVPEILTEVAKTIAPTLKATNKFLSFCVKYLPDAPRDRPDEEKHRIEWTEESLKKCLGIVYNYRSVYLHTGKRFPSLMLEAPHRSAEKPNVEMARNYRNREWKDKEVPITFDSFHYLCRGILINWCKSFVPA